MRRSIGAAAFVAMCSQRYRHLLNPTIPTIIPTACKAKITASRAYVSLQATSSARLRPTEHFRIAV